MLDNQTTLGATVSQSDKQTTISAILDYVLSEDLPSKSPVVDLSLFGVRDIVQIIRLLPGIDIETAASYNWQRIPTSRDLDAQAVELEEAIAMLELLATRDLSDTLADKILEDRIVLRRRAMRVYTALWDIRFKSVKWSRHRIEKALDQERARLWWAYTRELDDELKHLLRKQIDWFTELEQEALAL